MFSIRDLDRVRRWPLAWVFGPLILGGLLVTMVGFGLLASRGFPDSELGQKIDAAALEATSANDRDILLGNLTGFAWDEVCVFGPSATKESVDETIDIAWSRAGDSVSENELLLVFVRDGAVVKHAYVDRRALDEPDPGGECRSLDDPGTQVRPILGGFP